MNASQSLATITDHAGRISSAEQAVLEGMSAGDLEVLAGLVIRVGAKSDFEARAQDATSC
ncbi:hypothetical protein [Nonomuraea fuscirosea]|uniref:hypothetical protein n=1 Tax=Nonomuraea fuscirosea TaxID=1291556 RepID=UPI0033CE32E0